MDAITGGVSFEIFQVQSSYCLFEHLGKLVLSVLLQLTQLLHG